LPGGFEYGSDIVIEFRVLVFPRPQCISMPSLTDVTIGDFTKAWLSLQRGGA
jgi:hypothetical protein